MFRGLPDATNCLRPESAPLMFIKFDNILVSSLSCFSLYQGYLGRKGVDVGKTDNI